MLTLLALISTSFAATPAYDACPQEAEVAERLAPHLAEAMETWRIVRIDPLALEEALASGDEALLPGLDATGEPIEVAVAVADYDFAGSGREVGGKGDGDTPEALEDDLTVPLLLGCDAVDSACGVLTFFSADDGDTDLYEGVVSGGGEGSLYFESAHSLLALATGTPLEELEAFAPGCGVVYNGLHHVEVEREDDLGEPHDGEHDDDDIHPIDDDDAFIWAEVNIVLDGDQAFYKAGRQSVWARQRSLFYTVQASYALLEPLLGSNFSLLLQLESQEVWTSGGPTTTNGRKLEQDLNDSSYYMLNHPTQNEVSFFYYGVDVDGSLAGVAGGVCGLPGYDDTWGSNRTDQNNHAWAQQVKDANGFAFHTLKGRIGVMAHELGHMFGGVHTGSSTVVTRTNGPFSARGQSVMSDPAVTETWFNDTNAGNVYDCLDRVF